VQELYLARMGLLFGCFLLGDIACRAPIAEEGAVLGEFRHTVGAQPSGFDPFPDTQIFEVPERLAMRNG